METVHYFCHFCCCRELPRFPPPVLVSLTSVVAIQNLITEHNFLSCFPTSRYGGTITKQIKRLGASCDWTREHFTLDEQLSRKKVTHGLDRIMKTVRTFFLFFWRVKLLWLSKWLDITKSGTFCTFYHIRSSTVPPETPNYIKLEID